MDVAGQRPSAANPKHAVDAQKAPDSPNGRIMRNSGFVLASKVAPIAVSIFSIPILLNELGPTRFGILSLIWTLLSYFAIFDLGLGRAATHGVSEAVARGDSRRIGRILGTIGSFQLLLGCVAALLLLAAAPIIVDQLLDPPPEHVAEATLTLRLTALAVPLVLGAATLVGALEAFERFREAAFVQIPLSLVISLVPLTVVVMGFGLPAILGTFLALHLLSLISYVFMVYLTSPVGSFLPSFHTSQLKKSIRFGGWIAASNLLTPILLHTDRFVVASYLGLASFALYAIPMDILARGWIIPASLAAALFPAFTKLSVSGGTQLRRLYEDSRLRLGVVLGVTTLVIILSGPLAMRLWLGADAGRAVSPVLQVAAVGLFFGGMSQIPLTLLQSLEKPNVAFRLQLTLVPVLLLLLAILTPTWGAVGAATAWSGTRAIGFFLASESVRRSWMRSSAPRSATDPPEEVLGPEGA